MFTVDFDLTRLSEEELRNACRRFAHDCVQCAETGVPDSVRHPEAMDDLFVALTDALLAERERLARRQEAAALGVDVEDGEWVAGA